MIRENRALIRNGVREGAVSGLKVYEGMVSCGAESDGETGFKIRMGCSSGCSE